MCTRLGSTCRLCLRIGQVHWFILKSADTLKNPVNMQLFGKLGVFLCFAVIAVTKHFQVYPKHSI